MINRVREMIEQNTWIRNGMPVHVTCSAGIAELHEGGGNLADLAAAALRHAKEAGRNRVEKAA